MSEIRSFFPERDDNPGVAELLAPLCHPTLQAFEPRVLQLFREISRRISRSEDCRNSPELQALAFWLRPASIQRWQEEYDSLVQASRLLLPRGRVFHLPPGNVPLQFAYCWAYALVQGNTNIIRLSGRMSTDTEAFCRILREIADELPELRVDEHSLIIGFEHDENLVGAFSEASDVRVIWGGDETIRRIRRVPLPPRAIDLVFPDRSSLCMIRTKACMSLDRSAFQRLVTDFFNDAYSFDQLACASPRLVVWCGKEEESRRCAEDFFRMLADHLSEGEYRLSTGSSIERRLFATRSAIDLPVSRIREYSPELLVAEIDSPEGFRGYFCGGGFFFQAFLDQYSQLGPALSRRDQTLSVFGFSQDEIGAMLSLSGSESVHRVVPIGRALEFGRFWDGYDLLTAFSRWVPVDTGDRARS